MDKNKTITGISRQVIESISQYRNEPDWLLKFRLDAYSSWQKIKPPKWSELKLQKIDYSKIQFFSPAKIKNSQLKNLKNKLGLNIGKSKIAMDFVLDSNSVQTTFTKELSKHGIIFCGFSEAVIKYPELVKQYLGSVVPSTDNYYSCLNSAVFSDGSFCYIPSDVKCPLELSTYFRIQNLNSGQFERTLIIAEDNSTVSYLEGCTAPSNSITQLHCAVVEIIAKENAKVKYSTVQNWYTGDENGKGGVYNLVTKRGLCEGQNSQISWTQVETGSAITWKYPSVILKGDNSQGQFYSLTVTKNKQQADTGTKMIHIGKNTKSQIFSKSICSGSSLNTYRGKVQFTTKSHNSKNSSQCDTLFLESNKTQNQLSQLQKLIQKLQNLQKNF
jgi:Fe-S cluster assembly protein SufB